MNMRKSGLHCRVHSERLLALDQRVCTQEASASNSGTNGRNSLPPNTEVCGRGYLTCAPSLSVTALVAKKAFTGPSASSDHSRLRCQKLMYLHEQLSVASKCRCHWWENEFPGQREFVFKLPSTIHLKAIWSQKLYNRMGKGPLKQNTGLPWWSSG